MQWQNSSPLLTTPDVLIIGGGSAGVAAAVAATRSGASTVLLEKNSFAGGKATAANVGTICGLYYRSENPKAEFVHQGFPKEFALELQSRSGSQPVHYKNGLFFLPYNHFEFMRLCDELLHDTICFHATVFGAIATHSRVETISALIANRVVNFKPHQVIDATGEPMISSLLHTDIIHSDNNQAAAQVLQITGIHSDDIAVVNFALIRAIKSGIEQQQLPAWFEGVTAVPGSLQNGKLALKIPLPLVIDDHLLTSSRLEMFSRNAIHQLMNLLPQSGDLFKNCEVTSIAVEAGIRTGSRNSGKLLLTDADVLHCKKHAATITRGSWPVEFWEPGKKVFMEYFDMDDYYDIPADVLLSPDFKNLLFAGRNISATDKAIASARVIGTCLATGFAAGVLAASSVQNLSQKAAIEKIQNSFSGS